MTREEAKHYLSVPSSTNGSGRCTDEQHYEAKQIAIKALEQEPCDDVVSRQAVLDELNKWEWQELYLPIHFKENIIDVVPSVRPQEQTKEEHLDVFEVVNTPWIFLDNCANSGYYCSKCKKKLVKDGWSETVKKINFCPNCGAKMNEDNSN